MNDKILHLREEINKTDEKILTLIEKRTALAVEVGRMRGNANQDKSREFAIIARLLSRKTNKLLSDEAISAIWTCIFEQSRKAQARSIDTIES